MKPSAKPSRRFVKRSHVAAKSLHTPTLLDGGLDRCVRCQGFIVKDICYDYLGTYQPIPIWRCINCGHQQDRS